MGARISRKRRNKLILGILARLNDVEKFAIYTLVLLIPWMALQIRELLQIKHEDKRLYEKLSSTITVLMQAMLACLCIWALLREFGR